MRTIMLEIQSESFYDKLISFLNQNKTEVNIVDDSFAITTTEARQRVAKAVEEYRSGKMQTVPYEDGMEHIDKWLETL